MFTIRMAAIATIIAGLTTAAIAAEDACYKGYANATTNVETSVRKVYEYDYLYEAHCEKNGSLKQSSRKTDLTVIVKAFFLEGHDNQQKSEQRMQEFCKQHLGEKIAIGEQYNVARVVVVDALRLLNECIGLSGHGVNVSHEIQEPRSVIIRIDYDAGKTKMSLRNVVYDPRYGTCQTTALKTDGTPVVITRLMKESEVNKPFSVTCERKSSTTAKGQQKFDRFVVGVDTLWGTYTVVMPTEEMLGYDLANQNKLRYEGVLAQRDQLEKLLNNPTVQFHHVRVGEKPLGGFWEHWGCGTNVDAQMAKTCKEKKVVVKQFLQSHGGNKCGYSYFVYGCVDHGPAVEKQ